MRKYFYFILATALLASFSFSFGCKSKNSVRETTAQAVKTDRNEVTAIIGMKYSSLNDIAAWLAGGEEGYVCQNNNSYNIKIFYGVKDPSKRFLIMSKSIESGSESGLFEITDMIDVNIDNYPQGSTIEFNSCKNVNTINKDCQYVAVFNPNGSKDAASNWIKPERAWKPNPETGKIEEVSADSIRCTSEASIEEPVE